MEQWIVVGLALIVGTSYFYNKIKSGILQEQNLKLVKEDQRLENKQNVVEGEIKQLKQQLDSDKTTQEGKNEAEILQFWNGKKK